LILPDLATWMRPVTHPNISPTWTGQKPRARSFCAPDTKLLELKTGDHVLDVGCGLGHDAREFASMVGPGGRVVGIDFSEAMIAKARKRFEQANLPVQFAVGDAQRLNFADNSFDGCWSIRVLQHLVEPAYAIAEMARVARPGGRIAVFEPDHEMTAIDATDRVTTRIIRSSWVDRIRSGWAGIALDGVSGRCSDFQDDPRRGVTPKRMPCRACPYP
jgi:SAM-dependent methyltransferase